MEGDICMSLILGVGERLVECTAITHHRTFVETTGRRTAVDYTSAR